MRLEGIFRAPARASVRKPDWKSHLEYTGLDLRIILSLILWKRIGEYGLD
jgi:hypothetical protein